MRKKLFYMAVVGWGAAVLVHGLAFVGVDVASFVPFVWLLHVGIFAVWIPAVLKMRRAKALRSVTTAAGQSTSSGHVSKQAPLWLTAVAFAGMAYAVVNFVVFSSSATSTGEEHGRYYTHNRRKDRQPISAQAYHRLQANELRGFSGHWIGFYGMAMAILYPFKKPEEPEDV